MIHRCADVGAGRFLDQRGWILRRRGPKQRLDGRPDAVDNGSQIGRFVYLRLAQLVERSGDRPTLCMPQHDREPGLEALGGELDTADLRGRHDIARDANDEEVAEALSKDQLGGDAGVGAAEHDSEGLLPRAGAIRGAGNALDEAAISLAQARECFLRGDHGCGTFGGTSCLRQAEPIAPPAVWPSCGRGHERAAAAPRSRPAARRTYPTACPTRRLAYRGRRPPHDRRRAPTTTRRTRSTR